MEEHLGEQLSYMHNEIGTIYQTAACAWQLTADKQKEKKENNCVKGMLLKGLTSNSIPNQPGSENIQSKVSLQCCVCRPSILQRLQKMEKQQQRFDKALNKAASLLKAAQRQTFQVLIRTGGNVVSNSPSLAPFLSPAPSAYNEDSH